MLGVIKGIEKLKWQLKFVNEAYPDLMPQALQATSADVDYYPEDGDDPLTLDWVFTRDKETVSAFLDEVIAEVPLSDGPVIRSVYHNFKRLSWLIGKQVETNADFQEMAQAWLSTRDDEVRLFDPIEAHKVSISVAGTEPIAERLAVNGPRKRFGFDDGTLQRLEELKEKTPNFTNVIDCVMDAVNLAIRYNRPIRVTPILVVGEPGIGKSYFAGQLSQRLGVPQTRISVDNLQIGSDLAGSSYVYSKSSPGAVFRVLTEESHISPIVILDELDKACLNWGYGDPLGPLHNLLEPVSAKIYKDASFPIEIDASHVIWIAAANNLAPILNTLRSRFDVYKVSSPGTHQFDAILREIRQELEREYPGVSINNDVAKVLSGKTPREQRQLLQLAVGRAVRLYDDCVNEWHLKQVMGHAEARPRLGLVRESKGYL